MDLVERICQLNQWQLWRKVRENPGPVIQHDPERLVQQPTSAVLAARRTR